MSRPISRRLLVHSGSYRARTGIDSNQKPTYATAIPLKKVRFEPPKSTTLTDLGELQADRFTLFVDKVVSDYGAATFSQLDQVQFNGEWLTIRTAEPVYGNTSDIHHWEIQLS